MRSGKFLALVAIAGALVAATVPASAQTRAIIREGDTLDGYSVGVLDSPDVNSLGGWVLHLDLSDPNGTFDSAWGSIDGVAAPSILFMEGTYGDFVQTSWEGSIGMSDAGLIAYSPIGSDPLGTSLDAMFVNETPYAIEMHPMPPGPLQDLFWTFASRPNITANGMPYFVGGTDDTSGGATSARGLFNGTGTPVLYTGDKLPGLPAPLDNSSPVDFETRYSTFGSTYITEVLMETTGTDVTTNDDGVVVIDGLPLFIDGGIVREGSPIPASAGGLPGENWDNFDSMWINEAGEYIFTGDTDAATAVDEFVVLNGQIVLREGDAFGDRVISGAIENATMNAHGDWAVVWDVNDPLAGNVEALIFNGQLVLVEGVDDVDFDGDGVADVGARIAGLGFSGVFPDLRVSPRRADNTVTLYFVADVSNQGADDIEIFYAMPMSVPAGPDGDLELTVSDSPDPLTTVPGKITYAVRVRNNGPSALTGVTVVSTLDGDLAFDAANSDPIAVHSGEPLGGTVTAAIGDVPGYGLRTYRFVVDAAVAGEVTTTSVASANETDPDPANNSATNVTAVGSSSDMQIALTDSPDPVYDPAGQITYSVAVTNNGPSQATGVVATLTLDANTEFVSTTLGSHDGAPTGGVVTVNVAEMLEDDVVTFDVVVAAIAQGTVTADAAVSANQDDPVLDNNVASESTLFELTADLSVAMTDTPDPVIPVGGQITYTVDVENGGPSPATGVALTVALDDTTAFVSTSAGSHDGAPAGGVVTVDLGELAPDAVASVQIVVNTLAAGRAEAVATVTGSGNEIDPDPVNNAGPTYTLVIDDAQGLSTGVFSTITGHPTAQVPGLDGAEFDGFDRPFASPNTKLWILSASSNLGTSQDQVLIVGSPCAVNTIVQEGVTTLDPNTIADQVGLMDDELSINDAGSFAFATNTNGATTADEVIVKYDAVTKTFVTIAREGDFAAPTGFNYSTSMDSPQINQLGEVWFVADTDAPTDVDDFVLQKNGNAVVAQTGTTIPTGQAGTEPWDFFDSGDMSIDANGANWAIQGDIDGDTAFDDVFAVNNDIKIQEGVILPGSGFTSPAANLGIDYGRMTAASNWLARGDNADGQDWVLWNGAVLAATGDPVAPGSAEVYSDAPFSATYFAFAENNLGHYLIGGTTNAADSLSDAVLVLNGTQIVAREHDPIDLNGNGVLDDGVRIRTFGNDDLILTDDFQAYVTVTLRAFDDDGSNTDIGDAYIRINLCGAASGLCGDLDGDGDVDLGDYDVFRVAFGHTPCDAEYHACADFDGDGLVTFLDYQEWLKCYRAANGEIVRARANARVEAATDGARTDAASSAAPAAQPEAR